MNFVAIIDWGMLLYIPPKIKKQGKKEETTLGKRKYTLGR